MIELTKHGIKRARQRLGVPAKAVQKIAEQAWLRGEPITALSPRRELELRRTTAEGVTVRVWRGAVFIFGPNAALVTVLPGDHGAGRGIAARRIAEEKVARSERNKQRGRAVRRARQRQQGRWVQHVA